MAAVLFVFSQDAEVDTGRCQQPRRCAGDFLHAIVVRADAVDEIKRVGAFFLADYFHGTTVFESFGPNPIGALLLQFRPGVAAFFERLERLLQRLRHDAFVHHGPPDIDDLVDVFDRHRTLLFTGTTGRTGPDFVLLQNSADQLGFFDRLLP